MSCISVTHLMLKLPSWAYHEKSTVTIKLKAKANLKENIPSFCKRLKIDRQKIIATGLLVNKKWWDAMQHCFKTRNPNAMQNNRLLDTVKIKARNIISEFKIEDDISDANYNN